MSLQGADGGRRFLAECEIEVAANGAVGPIEYEGRRYLFSHTAPASGYHPDAQEELYVFREPGAIA